MRNLREGESKDFSFLSMKFEKNPRNQMKDLQKSVKIDERRSYNKCFTCFWTCLMLESEFMLLASLYVGTRRLSFRLQSNSCVDL